MEPPMPAATATTKQANPFEQAKAKLIERLGLLVMPKPIRVFPGPSDFLEAGRALRDVAELFNDYVRAIGDEVENNSPFHVDSRSFDNVVTDAISDCAYTAESIAERLQDEREAA
jgi:hypothetical protein